MCSRLMRTYSLGMKLQKMLLTIGLDCQVVFFFQYILVLDRHNATSTIQSPKCHVTLVNPKKKNPIGVLKN